MNHADEFKTFSIRNPAASVAGLRRMTTAGDCLAPILAPGDVVYVDESDTEPKTDDIVMFEWPQSDTKYWNASDKKEEWIKQFGHADFTIGLKLYWESPPETHDFARIRLLIANDGMREVQDHKMLGRVVAVERDGVLLKGDIICRDTVPVASIDPNAVSTIGSATNANTVTLTGPHSNSIQVSVISITVVTTGGPTEIDASCTASVVTANGSWFNPCGWYIQRDGAPLIHNGFYDATAEGNYQVGTGEGNLSNGQQITLTITDTPTAGTHIYQFVMSGGLNVASSGSGTMSSANARIKVHEIKK
jgi:hypothetical protein